MQHRGTDLMWADGNMKLLQGNRFWLFRFVLLGIPVDYNDNIKRRNTHPLLIPKAEAEGVISKEYIDVLKRTMGSTDDQEHTKGVKCKSILQTVKTVANTKECVGWHQIWTW